MPGIHPFRVVTHQSWLFEYFNRVGAFPDFGFDIDPDTALKTVQWAPGAWVAGVAEAGITLPLLSYGPIWLDTVSQRYTR
jgi:hypothetical protein